MEIGNKLYTSLGTKSQGMDGFQVDKHIGWGIWR